MPHLEIVELVLVHSNLVHNDYQQHSRILYYIPNKPFDSLLEISSTNHIFLKTLNFKKSVYGLQTKIVSH